MKNLKSELLNPEIVSAIITLVFVGINYYAKSKNEEVDLSKK